MNSASSWRTPLIIIAAGCLIAFVGFGIRSTFGLFLEPMTITRGWSRETFALAMAIQNLLWGVGLPVAGALADRFGASRVLAGGAIVYAIGTWGMAGADSALALHLFGGILTGLGVAFTAFSIALARNSPSAPSSVSADVSSARCSLNRSTRNCLAVRSSQKVTFSSVSE